MVGDNSHAERKIAKRDHSSHVCYFCRGRQYELCLGKGCINTPVSTCVVVDTGRKKG